MHGHYLVLRAIQITMAGRIFNLHFAPLTVRPRLQSTETHAMDCSCPVKIAMGAGESTAGVWLLERERGGMREKWRGERRKGRG